MIRLKSMFSTNTYIQLLSYTKIGGHFLHNSAGMTAVRLSAQKLRGDVTMTEVTAAQFFVQNPAVMDVENQLAS